MVTSNLLISRLNITFNHQTFYQSVKFRINLAAVENFFCDTNLLVILLVGVGVVGINDNSRVFQVLLLIFFPEKTKVFIVIVRDSFSVFVYSTTKNGMSKFITCGLYFPASVDEAMSALSSYNITARSPLVGFFIPAGISMPLTVRRCCWSSTERAPTAT